MAKKTAKKVEKIWATGRRKKLLLEQEFVKAKAKS